MEEIVLDYFSFIFQTNGPTNTSAIIDVVQPVVIDAMNEHLTQDFHADEVHRALKQMHPKKSLDPDGMPPSFINTFGRYWVSV